VKKTRQNKKPELGGNVPPFVAAMQKLRRGAC
jgi:hypothetical protein